jgi:4-hydroxyacetophenone monooxygenase
MRGTVTTEEQSKIATDTSAADAYLWTALQSANVPVLLMVLAQLTSDLRWIRAPYAPSRTRGMDDNDTGGLPEAIQLEVRKAAFDLLRNAPKASAAPAVSPELLAAMMTSCMGEEVPAEYAPMMLEEMGLRQRLPSWPRTPAARRLATFRVTVIGAGVSGICAAIALRAAGIPFRVLEKSSSVGGTWLENRYPGCGVDTPSHLYSFSFAPQNWSRYFARQDEIEHYLEDCVDRFGVGEHIQLDTEVLTAAFDESTDTWRIEARHSDGSIRSHSANVVISAVGQLNQPAEPVIDGASRFHGPAVHSARWPEDLEVGGKRVCVIGTGASAMQIVPAIANVAAQVTVFQRSPQWAVPSANYQREVPPEVRYLMDTFPLYAAWYRCRLVWSYSDKVHQSLQIDPDWSGGGLSINAANDGHRRSFTRYLTEQVGERVDLIPKVLPAYPPFAKRMLIDNGWYRTMTRDNVQLVVDGIKEITEDGAVDERGQPYPADVIVYATGFQTLRFIGSYEVRGRGGRSLRDEWGDDDARAYLGMTVPSFPNFFCLYGPNTGLGHGGSVILLSECATRYIISAIQEMIVKRIDTIEIKQSVYDSYNHDVDEAHNRMIWTHPGTTNWYRNRSGRVVSNSPWRVVDYWRMTRKCDFSDFTIGRRSRQ